MLSNNSCLVLPSVLPETQSSGNKVKLTGIIITEANQGIKNEGAVEYVGDISMRSKDGKMFEVSNQI